MRKVYQLLLPIFLLLLFVVPRIGAQNEVANYPFSGNANDVSSYHNNATIHGASLTQDRFGRANQAFLFDGVQSHLVANNAPQLQSPTISVSFWVRADAFPVQGEVYLLSHGGYQDRWKISLPTQGKLVWTTHAASCCVDTDSGDPLEVDTWTHVVMIHDGAKDLIYVNGVLANEKDAPGDLNGTTRPLGMGYSPIDNDYFFNGALDDVIIYDGVLNDSGVAALYAEQSTPPAVINELVANYPFSKNFRDESPFANHASGRGVEFIPDRFGFGDKAASFNGVDSRVDAANSAQLNSPTTTVSFWVKVNSFPVSGESYLLSFGGWQQRWKISLPGHKKPVWSTKHENGNADLDTGDGDELQIGQWTHLVMVHDGLKDLIYMNGVLVADRDAIGLLLNTTHPLGMGYDAVEGGGYFDGALDEVQIYNFALSDIEISDLYTEQNTAVIDPDPLVLNLPFCGDFRDVSQFGNNAKSYGAEFTDDRFRYANNAVYLDEAKGAYAEVDNSVQYNSDYTTVSFWVNLDALPGGDAYLLSFGGWQQRWKINVPDHGKVIWTTNSSSGVSDMDAGGGNELVPGIWTHVVTSHGPVLDKIYINGILAASKNVGGTLNHTTRDLGIGWNPVDPGNYMDGDIDEVRIYNRDLTDQEVADLYAEQNAFPVFPGNIVADYPLNANGHDVSPYCNHGDVYGAVASLDRFGRSNHAMDFDGDEDYIVADNSQQLNSPLASVSFWINVSSFPASGESYLLSFGGWQQRWKISLPDHRKPVWSTKHENGNADLDTGDGDELEIGEWTHLVMVHDGVKDLIYMNGVLVADRDAVGMLLSTTHPLGMGYDAVEGGRYFDGALDDILIYDSALTGPEVAALYALQAADPGGADVTAPDAPSGLEGTVKFTTVELIWQPSVDVESGIAGYNVYQDGAVILTTEEFQATIAGLAPLTSYEFGVSAVDSAGNESAASFITLVTGPDEAPDTIPPSKPGNLAITAGSNSVVFSWDASTDNQAVAGYVVLLDGAFVDSLDAGTTSIFIGGLDPSTDYTFEVYAFDLAGNESEIADITESTTEPIETAEPGLVAHYKFEGDANDATPYNNHGSIGGNPTFEAVTGHPFSDMVIVFDGDGDSIFAPNAVQLISDFTTVSFWIRLDGQNLDDSECYILDFGHWDERWKVSLPLHRKIVWTTHGHNAQFPDLTHDMDAGGGNELVVGFWFYVTMVHDGTDDIIYLDGQEVARQPFATILNSTARPFIMGSDAVEGRRYFIGALDEVKVYNKALTSAEIEQLFETGTTGIEEIQNELNKFVEIIYPNPTKDQLLIKHGFGTEPLLIRIFDQLGRQVEDIRVDAKHMDTGLIPINVGTLQGGVYSLNFVLGGKNMGSVPFVKQ